MGKIRDFLYEIDLFNLKFDNIFLQEKHFSLKSGQIFTLSLMLLLIPSFIYFGDNLFYKKNPKVIYSTMSMNNVPEYNFKDNNFFLFTKVTNRTSRKEITDISRYYRFLGIYQSEGFEHKLVFEFIPCNFSNVAHDLINKHPIYGKRLFSSLLKLSILYSLIHFLIFESKRTTEINFLSIS